MEHSNGHLYLRAESFYNVASNIDELDAEPCSAPPLIANYGGISLHKQSHGESFMSLVENRFRGNGLYILDEPEAALSPILMTFPDAEVLEITEAGIQLVHYKDTEHYIVTKRFMDAPEKMVKSLFEGE